MKMSDFKIQKVLQPLINHPRCDNYQCRLCYELATMRNAMWNWGGSCLALSAKKQGAAYIVMTLYFGVRCPTHEREYKLKVKHLVKHSIPPQVFGMESY